MRAAIFSVCILVNSLSLADDGVPASVATMPPVVVKTIPEAGAIDVDPAITEIRATFSKSMITENFSWVQTVKETFPTTTAKPHFEQDQRTCVLPVKLEPGQDIRPVAQQRAILVLYGQRWPARCLLPAGIPDEGIQIARRWGTGSDGH
jgi:hypothetical protein